MKKLLLLFILIAGLQSISQAQYVTIPDDYFRSELKYLYPSCFNVNDMLDTTCTKVVNEKSLTVISYYNLTSFQGIQYFKSLRFLDCSDNRNLSFIPSLPSTLDTLYCTSDNLTNLPPLPNRMKLLKCADNKLTAFVSLPDSLEYLECYSNHLAALPPLSNKLSYLDCRYNNITSLPVIPSNLSNLMCSFNQITSLPTLPNNLELLYCENNKLSALPAIPKVRYLVCSRNSITSIPPLSSQLYSIYAGYNKLQSLILPNSVKYVDCSGNNFSSLPIIPSSVILLRCDSNQWVTLPALPYTLGALSCKYNRLTTLPPLPNVSNLNCSYNKISQLPVLPVISLLNCSHNLLTSLSEYPTLASTPGGYLDCSYNYLTTLPPIPLTVQTLYCNNNLLTSLPSLPPRMNNLYVNDNPLSCLPILPNGIISLYVKNTNIKCRSNTVVSSNISHDTLLPICADAADICEENPFVTGRIYQDKNNNGIYDSLIDALAPNYVLNVSPGNWLGVSVGNGDYSVKLDTSSSNIWTVAKNFKYSTITPVAYSLSNIHSVGLVNGNYDFGIQLIPNIKDLTVSLGSCPVRPGFTTYINLSANNAGTINQSNITLKLKKPNGFNIVATSVTPNYTTNDTLIWNNISIDLLKSKSFGVQLQVPVSAQIGDSISYEAWVNGTQVDSTPADNYTRWVEVVRGSFDPNDKLVNKLSLLPTYDPDKDRLLYTIRFQNTGTDTAYTVIVRDVISDNLEVTSLRVVNASHPYQLIVREKNIVEVAFPNIQLPDSNSNEARSHGFVQLEFKPKAGLPVNTEINNDAAIFFDYNAPVVTNTATTKIEILTGVASNKHLAFRLFPNPSTGNITLELPNPGKGKWSLLDISGKMLRQNSIAGGNTSFEINISDLASGTYVFLLELNGIISSSKVVITR